MSKPWLSILLPVYNVEPYLRECVESIASQADDGVEIVLVDDVSTDGSRALLHTLQGELKGRLRLLQHQVNGGLSAARNTMLEAATGEYVWFFDSDDVLAPGAIADLKAVVEHDRPDFVMCDFLMLRERTRLKHRLRGELHRRTFAGPSGVTLQDPAGLVRGMLEAGQLHAWSKVSRRSLWGTDLRFPVGKFFEDQVVMPRLALRAESYQHVPRVWVAYRQRAGSILASASLKKAEDMSRAMVGFAREFMARVPEATKEARFAIAYFCAKNFIGVARLIGRGKVPDQGLMKENRNNFLDSIPLTLAELRAEYLRRGWWWRWLRLNYWLERSQRFS